MVLDVQWEGDRAADIGLRTIIGQIYNIGHMASKDEVRAIAQQWQGFRGWAAFYLRMTLQQQNKIRAENKNMKLYST